MKDIDSGMPLSDLTTVWFPNDHTSGTRPGSFTPEADVADNDLAVGKLVDAITHSQKYWHDEPTVIFIVEDDAQGGLDHVEGHRTVGLIVSPFNKKHQVFSTNFNQLNMLRTIEQILNIPPLNQFDAAAIPMRSVFQEKGDFQPYTAHKNLIALNAVNPPLKKLSGTPRHWGGGFGAARLLCARSRRPRTAYRSALASFPRRCRLSTPDSLPLNCFPGTPASQFERRFFLCLRTEGASVQPGIMCHEWYSNQDRLRNGARARSESGSIFRFGGCMSIPHSRRSREEETGVMAEQAVNKRGRVAHLLKEAILCGRLRPGTRLPEIRLGRELGVSQAIVREAFQELESQGLITKKPGHGSYVIELTADDLVQIYQVRGELEAMACALSTLNYTHAIDTTLQACIHGMRAAATGNDFPAYARSDIQFHRSIWAAQPNRFLEKTLESVCLPLFAYDQIRRASTTSLDYTRVTRQHEIILIALQSGDPERTARLMKRMMQRWLRIHLGEYARIDRDNPSETNNTVDAIAYLRAQALSVLPEPER